MEHLLCGKKQRFVDKDTLLSILFEESGMLISTERSGDIIFVFLYIVASVTKDIIIVQSLVYDNHRNKIDLCNNKRTDAPFITIEDLINLSKAKDVNFYKLSSFAELDAVINNLPDYA